MTKRLKRLSSKMRRNTATKGVVNGKNQMIEGVFQIKLEEELPWRKVCLTFESLLFIILKLKLG